MEQQSSIVNALFVLVDRDRPKVRIVPERVEQLAANLGWKFLWSRGGEHARAGHCIVH